MRISDWSSDVCSSDLHRRRHAARPVQREGVHGIEHAVLHGIEKLEVADHVLRAERLESQLAAGLLDDAVAPVLEDLQPDTARPGRLNLPGRSLTLGRADEGRADLVADAEYGSGAASGERGLETDRNSTRLNSS